MPLYQQLWYWVGCGAGYYMHQFEPIIHCVSLTIMPYQSWVSQGHFWIMKSKQEFTCSSKTSPWTSSLTEVERGLVLAWDRQQQINEGAKNQPWKVGKVIFCTWMCWACELFPMQSEDIFCIDKLSLKPVQFRQFSAFYFFNWVPVSTVA